MKIVGDRIVLLRKALGMSQKELAQRVGYKPSSVSDWESGRHLPDNAAWPGLAQILGCSIDDLFGTEPSHPALRAPALPGSEPPSESPGAVPRADSPERPAWVEDLVAAEQGTEAAIRWQADIFCGEIKVLNERMEQRDRRQEERQEARDQRSESVIQALMGVVERNTAMMERATATISRLEARLDAYERDPLDEDDEGKSDGHAARAG